MEISCVGGSLVDESEVMGRSIISAGTCVDLCLFFFWEVLWLHCTGTYLTQACAYNPINQALCE